MKETSGILRQTEEAKSAKDHKQRHTQEQMKTNTIKK
jgi:hypothetical protein